MCLANSDHPIRQDLRGGEEVSAPPDEIDLKFASEPAGKDKRGRGCQGVGVFSLFCIEFRDDAADQRLVYSVFRCFAQ
jgi:hypothetical protein